MSHDCRPFLRLKANELERGPAIDETVVVMLRQLADDISPGGYVQDAYTQLHSQETRVLRDLGSAEKGAYKIYLEALLVAIDRVRMVMRDVDVETGKKMITQTMELKK